MDFFPFYVDYFFLLSPTYLVSDLTIKMCVTWRVYRQKHQRLTLHERLGCYSSLIFLIFCVVLWFLLCLSLCCILYTQCCKRLWIVNYWFPHQLSLTFICTGRDKINKIQSISLQLHENSRHSWNEIIANGI